MRDRERESNSTGQGALGAGETAQDPASPWDRQRLGRPRTAGTFLPRAEQISGPDPGASRPLQTESSIVTVGAESRALELAAAAGVVPPGASRGKQPPLRPAPGRGQSSSPKC